MTTEVINDDSGDDQCNVTGNRYDRKSAAGFAAICLLMLPGIANATLLDNFATAIQSILSGPLVTAIGILVIAGIAFMFFRGIVNWAGVVFGLVGVVILLSAPAVLTWVQTNAAL